MPIINKINSYYPVNIFSGSETTNVPKRSDDFKELIRRVTLEERINIDKKLALIADNKDVKIQMLHEALESQNWDHEIFQDENYPYYALEAVGLEEGNKHKLSRGQFATLMSYWKTSQDHQARSMALFNTNGSINEEARKIIKETLRLIVKEPIYFLTDEQIEQLFKEMAQLPRSEQQFFIIPSSKPKVVTAKAVIRELGINIFSEFTEKDHDKCMIASFGLMQAFLKVKFGQDAVEMQPVIGLSSIDDIRANGLNGQRDFAVHFPEVFLPGIADDVQALGFEFSYHDFYHAFVASSAPKKFPPLYIQIADIVQTFKNQSNKASENKIQKMYEQFIDMDITTFRHELRNDSSLNDLFWEYLDSIFERIECRTLKELKLKTEIAEKIGRELPLIDELLEGPGQVLSEKIQEIDDKITEFFKKNPSISKNDDLTEIPLLFRCHFLKKMHPLKFIDAVWKQRLQIEAG